MDALEILSKDHRAVEKLFTEFGEAKGAHATRLARKIVAELAKHAAIEEQTLYPEARRELPDAVELVDEALAEHREMKKMLADLEGASAANDDLQAKVANLSQLVRHHVAEEEARLFPEIERTLGRDRLLALGEFILRSRSGPGNELHGLVESAAASPAGTFAEEATGDPRAAKIHKQSATPHAKARPEKTHALDEKKARVERKRSASR